ncbi:MAG: N-acetyltransferase family protein [Actinomycetota bacterium]
MYPHVIREGSVLDIEPCVALALLAAPERGAADWRESLRRDIEDPEHHLVVAESGSEIVGYGRARLFEPEPDGPADTAPPGHYLTGLFVRPDRRRIGTGGALIQARLDRIVETAAEAWYFANARNVASIELHRRFGFEEVTRRFSFPGLTFHGGEGILFRLELRRHARPGAFVR